MNNIYLKQHGLLERMFIIPYIKKMLKKKLGIQPDLSLGLACNDMGDEEVCFNIVVEGKISKSDLEKLKGYLLNN